METKFVFLQIMIYFWDLKFYHNKITLIIKICRYGKA